MAKHSNCMLMAAGAIVSVVLFSFSAHAQQQRSQTRQVYACSEIHKRCVNRSPGRGSSACDGYYADAQRTGVWPAFGQSPAVSCTR